VAGGRGSGLWGKWGDMGTGVIVWDLETVPDLERFALPMTLGEKRFGANYISYKEKVRRWL
jgi:hypothetical protein